MRLLAAMNVHDKKKAREGRQRSGKHSRAPSKPLPAATSTTTPSPPSPPSLPYGSPRSSRSPSPPKTPPTTSCSVPRTSPILASSPRHEDHQDLSGEDAAPASHFCDVPPRGPGLSSTSASRAFQPAKVEVAAFAITSTPKPVRTEPARPVSFQWQQRRLLTGSMSHPADIGPRRMHPQQPPSNPATQSSHSTESHAGPGDAEVDLHVNIASLITDRDAFREAYNEAVEENRAKDEMVRELQGHIRGLKNFVSSSSKMDEQISDEAFAEMMQTLGNGLQNWVITNFRRAQLDIYSMDDRTRRELSRLVPTYQSLAETSKIHLIQSFVSSRMIEDIFEAYFVGLPEFRSEALMNAQSCMSIFGPEESVNTWRATTLGIIRRGAAETLVTETAEIIDNLMTSINSVLDAVSDVTASEARDQSLRTLLVSAIDLARLLRVQRAEFTVGMPLIEQHQQVFFDPTSMDDISGEDEEMLESREISCVVFPGIIKAGDEMGSQGHLRNVIARVRVTCSPD